MFSTITLAANQRVEFVEPFDFIRVMDTTAAVSLEFYRQGREVDEANGVTAGYSESFANPCDRLAITNGATAQTITVATRLGSKVEYDKPPTGNVSVTNMPAVLSIESQAAAVSQWSASVGTSSALLTGANNNRRAVIVQNKSATATIWVNVANQPATVGSGLKIGPGESFTWETRVSTMQWNAIADAGTNEICMIEVS